MLEKHYKYTSESPTDFRPSQEVVQKHVFRSIAVVKRSAKRRAV